MAKIDVVVTVFNEEKYISKCLDSILVQSFKNFNVIIVDDGSTDNSYKICKMYENKDIRIHYFYKENGGLSDARNFGIKKSEGKYITFIDGDDYVNKQFLEKLYNSMILTNSEVAVCGHQQVRENGRIIFKVNLPDKRKVISGKELIYENLQDPKLAYGSACVKLYNRNLFKNILFKKNRYFEDTLILNPLFWNIKKVSLVHESLYNYVQHNYSIMHSEFSLKKWKDYNQLYLDQIGFFYKNRAWSLYKIVINNYLNWIFFNFTNLSNFKELQDELQINFRKYTKENIPLNLQEKIRNKVGNLSLKIIVPIFKLKKFVKRLVR